MIKILLVVLLLFSSAADKFLSAQTDLNDFHYEPVEGKSLGIWPKNIMAEFDYLDNYKNELGFEFVLLQPKTSDGNSSSYYYDLAIDAGFITDNIMIQITDLNYKWASENLDAKNYYLGEPVEHDCSGNNSNEYVSHIYPPSELTDIRIKIKSDDSTANFMLDGYKRCSHLIIAGYIADQVMYSSYTDWNELRLLFQCFPDLGWGSNPEYGWLTGNDNQSLSWYNMAEVFGSKFKMSWVHGEGDEYAALFETADSIGLQTIFLYALPLSDDENIIEFCEIAYQSGWLEKVYDMDFFPPYNLHAQEIEIGVVNLTWEDSTDFASGYLIEKQASVDSSFTLVDSLDSFTYSYSDSNVVENQTYYYRIYSYTDERKSMYSDTVAITTSVRPITAPSDLQAEFENNLVLLSWQDNSDNEASFFIERKQNESSEFNLIDSVEMDAVQYKDSSITTDGIYQYRIFAGNEFTRSAYSDTVEINIILTGLEDLANHFNFELHQNFPNPFNPATTIKYSIPEFSRQKTIDSRQHRESENRHPKSNIQNQGSVSLIVYDILGREVATLVNAYKRPGNYQVIFNADILASGIYYYSLNVNGRVMTKKMILLR